VVDKLLGRDSLELRAVRLREIIQRVGGTAVKLGQQAAMRTDLLPYAYSAELSKMLDNMPAFPVEYAIRRLTSRFGTLFASFAVIAYRLVFVRSYGFQDVDTLRTCLEVLAFLPYQLLIGLLMLLNLRRILLRFSDKEVERSTTAA
jgi:hypothetical protein